MFSAVSLWTWLACDPGAQTSTSDGHASEHEVESAGAGSEENGAGTDDDSNGDGDGDGDGDGNGDGEDGADQTDQTWNDGDCIEIQCDPASTEDCGPGRKCGPWRCGDGCCTNATKCVDVTGNAQVDEPCTRDAVAQEDDCAASLFCMPDHASSGHGGPGHCVQLCSPEPGGSGNCEALGVEGAHCFSQGQGSFPVCIRTCDPLSPKCPDDRHCYLSIDNFFCLAPTAPDGGPGEPGAPGVECEAEQGCQAGTVCAPAQINRACDNSNCGAVDVCGCCQRVCDLEADDPDEPCAEGEVCVVAIANGTSDVAHVGVCVTPN